MKGPRWYVDADTLSLAHVMIRARPEDFTFPGDDGKRHKSQYDVEPCVIQDRSTPDEVWIPRVTAADLAIISRDRHIERRTSERDQIIACRGRMFAVTSRENLDTWGLVQVLASQWPAIEEAAAQAGPYIYSVTRSGIRELDLY